MIKYRYALNENGNTVCADEIAGAAVTEKFTCLGCEGLLIAKVNGEKVRPHFAHKVQAECNGETYLHKLGKAAFFEIYTKCLRAGEPFKIHLSATKICRKFFPALMPGCNLGSVEKEYDLTAYFQDIRVERRDGEFVPDVLISNKKNPAEKVYIEIACTHFLSERKVLSGNRIIEIPIETEEDIEKIQKASLSANDALFIGFNHSTEAITDSDCRCAAKKSFAFFFMRVVRPTWSLTSLRLCIQKRESQIRLFIAIFSLPAQSNLSRLLIIRWMVVVYLSSRLNSLQNETYPLRTATSADITPKVTMQ